ncbi:MAG: FecR domain-containing protein [Alphaproteobacteria bacterium]|nr:FecR domain-containing protein [Alphaproteobacteria bacterium]
MGIHFLASAALATLMMCSVAWADSIGKVVAVVGAPTSTGPSGKHELHAGSPVFENDKITVTTGNAQILFDDGTKLVVGPSSTLVITKFLLRGNSNTAQDLSIKALRGTFRFITGKSAKGAYDIQTANATIGIRGTGFDFWVSSSTGVAVLKGKVRLSDKLRSKTYIDISQGCELGTTEGAVARQFRRADLARRIVNHLPFIVNQSALKKAFQLNTQACSAALSELADEPGSSRSTTNSDPVAPGNNPYPGPNGPPATGP